MDNNDHTCFTTGGDQGFSGHVTLGDMVQRIASMPDLTVTQKRDLTSAIRRAAALFSVIGLQADATPAFISSKLKGFSPAMAGMTPQTFANFKSLLRRAFRIVGVSVQPGKNTGPLPEMWDTLLAMIPDIWDRRRLDRFANFAARQGWAPAEITTEHMLRFLTTLAHEAINGDEREDYVQACKTWNKLADTLPTWPGKAVTIQHKRTSYMVKIDDLEPTLRFEIETYLDVLAAQGSDEPVFFKGITRKSLSPVTVSLRRTQIMQYVSALAAQGHPLASLTSIDAITQPAAITAAMNFLFLRAGQKVATQIQFIALAVRGLLYRHLTGQLRRRTRQDKDRPAPPTNAFIDPRIDLLDEVIRITRPTDRGLAAKNKRCNAQFDDRHNVAALLHLPGRLMTEAAKTGGKEGARLAEVALAIELLLMCPIRIGNLVGLDLARHIIRCRPDKKGVVHVVIPKDEVKNKREIEFELPAGLTRMLDRHIKDYRPLLPGAGSTWLFPSTEGGPRLYKLLARQISGIVHRYTGLTMTPHQFRHVGGKLFLEANPTGHEIVRQVLGHASIDTTTQHYTGINQVKAGRTFDKGVLALREKTKFIISKRSKS
jgi:integrase